MFGITEVICFCALRPPEFMYNMCQFIYIEKTNILLCNMPRPVLIPDENLRVRRKGQLILLSRKGEGEIPIPSKVAQLYVCAIQSTPKSWMYYSIALVKKGCKCISLQIILLEQRWGVSCAPRAIHIPNINLAWPHWNSAIAQNSFDVSIFVYGYTVCVKDGYRPEECIWRMHQLSKNRVKESWTKDANKFYIIVQLKSNRLRGGRSCYSPST